MKTNENNLSPEERVRALELELADTNKKLAVESTNRKWWTGVSVVIFIAFLIVLFCAKCEGDKMANRISELEKANQELLVEAEALKCEIGCLKKELEYKDKEIEFLEDVIEVQKKEIEKNKKEISRIKNQKPALVVSEETKDGKSLVNVKAIIVNKSSNLPSEEEFECSNVQEDYSDDFISKDECNEYVECLRDSLNMAMNDSVEVIMTKESQDNSWEVMRARVAYADMLNMPANPAISGSHTFTEYWENPFRRKKEKSFRNALILTGTSAGLYAVSEAVKTPIYRDPPADNSDAKRRSNIILGLRIGSGITGTAAAFEFGRTWYFHHMEGKYIISPTKIGVVVNLDSLGK